MILKYIFALIFVQFLSYCWSVVIVNLLSKQKTSPRSGIGTIINGKEHPRIVYIISFVVVVFLEEILFVLPCLILAKYCPINIVIVSILFVGIVFGYCHGGRAGIYCQGFGQILLCGIAVIFLFYGVPLLAIFLIGFLNHFLYDCFIICASLYAAKTNRKKRILKSYRFAWKNAQYFRKQNKFVNSLNSW